MTEFTFEYVRDYIEIRDLSARYLYYANVGDGNSLALLYTEDGEYHSNGFVYKGRGQLAKVVSAATEIVHLTCDPLIEIDGDEARQISQKISAHRALDKSSNEFVATGQYVDHLVRTPSGWRFKRREAELHLRTDLYRKAQNLPQGRLDQ